VTLRDLGSPPPRPGALSERARRRFRTAPAADVFLFVILALLLRCTRGQLTAGAENLKLAALGREHRVSTDSTKLWIAIGFGCPAREFYHEKISS
jgi:hypothetical protein